MEWPFTKMQGCGNDYIYFNCMEHPFPFPEKHAARLSDRHFGIGGDGIILINPSDSADAFMRIYNADNSEGRMCGNGIRCAAKYLYDHNIVNKTEMTIDTLSGAKKLFLMLDASGAVSSVRVDMGKYQLTPEHVPVNLPGCEVIARSMHAGDTNYEVTCVSMGNPHAVIFMDNIKNLDLKMIGPLFENHPLFPDGVNTEFVRFLDEFMLEMRVWERGSGETLACGTGACAAAVAAVLSGYCQAEKDIRISLAGGMLSVRVAEDRTVFMTGDCVKVFDGVINLV